MRPENYRSKKICNTLRDTFEPPKVVKNFLTLLELNTLIDVLSSHNNYERYTPGALISGFNWEDLKHCLYDKIFSEIGAFNVTGGNFFTTTRPYHPHVDSGKEYDSLPYKVILIPLNIFPVGRRTKTHFFNQRYIGPAANLFLNTKHKKPIYNSVLTNYEDIDFINGNDLYDMNDYSLINHVEYELLNGLSKECELEWDLGTAIIFDRTHIHCSSNFKKNGIIAKTGLSIFTNKL